MTFYSERHIFFMSGNLKNGQGTLKSFFPDNYNDPEVPNCKWQVNISYVSFVANNRAALNNLVFMSTNLIRDYKVNNAGQSEIWNPYVIHLRMTGSSHSFSIGPNWLPLSSFSRNVELFFTDASDNKPFLKDIDVKVTMIVERRY